MKIDRKCWEVNSVMISVRIMTVMFSVFRKSLY